MSDDLLKLAECCEAATGQSRDVDIQIPQLIKGLLNHRDPVPFYTASIDSALTLVPEHVFDEVATGAGTQRCFAQLIYPKRSFIFPSGIVRRPPSIYVLAATQPLAIVAAALRARARSAA